MNYLHLPKKITSSSLIYFIIILFPFLIFYWMIPFVSDLKIGHDYLRYSLRAQLELLFSLKKGSYPLYVPGFASGHASIALTLGQLFHPLSHMASLMPGYWDGKAMEWNNFFKLVTLGITHLAIFLFLKKIRLNLTYSFLLSFITVYNLKMLHLFKAGANLEAYTGHIILCILIGWFFIDPKKWLGPLSIIGVTYLLVCSGQPEEMYYGLLGAGLFALVTPFFVSTMLNDREVNFKIASIFWSKIGLYIFLGVMLSSAYIVPFYFDFITDNISRVGRSYEVSNTNLDSFFGIVNNFFFPLSSDSHSAFGGSALFLIAATLPLLRLFRIKIPRSVWTTWCIILFVFLHMQGERTPVHRLIWEYVPFSSSITEPGRISIIMPFFMMILLSWIIKTDSTANTSTPFRPLTVLVLASLLLIVTYCSIFFLGTYIFKTPFFLKNFNPFYFSGNFLHIHPSFTYFRVQLFLVVLGLILLIAFILYNLPVSMKMANVFGTLLIVTTLLQVGVALRYRAVNFSEEINNTPTLQEKEEEKKEKLNYRYHPGVGMHSAEVVKQLKNSFLEPFSGKIFTQVIPVADQREAYNLMQKERFPQQVFIEGYDLRKARNITEDANKDMKKGSVKLVYSSFNRLQFHVYSETASIFGLSYPYTGNWRAWLNGKRIKIYRANGVAHAVEIPYGESILEFRYWSRTHFWGMAISITTFIIIGFFVCFRAFRGLARISGIIIILAIGMGVFSLWYNSLYAGDNLKTEYTWTYTPPSKNQNIAYGKKNWLNSSALFYNKVYSEAAELYGGRLVDGDKSPGSGFVTCFYNNPAWFVDLQKVEKINKVVFYQSANDFLFLNPVVRIFVNCSLVPRENLTTNTGILEILISDNGIEWSEADSVNLSLNNEGIKEVVFRKPQKTRFVQIKLRGKGQLRFDEIEIYRE